MKTITFTYTKPDHSVSERLLLAFVTPGGDKYAGIDISELEPKMAACFIADAEKLHQEYLEDVRRLQKLYDVKYGYKQFLVSRMNNVTEI